MKNEETGKQKQQLYMSKKSVFPLTLDWWEVKYMEYSLGYTRDALKKIINKRKDNVEKIVLHQVRNGKPKERIVYDPSDDYKKLLKIINKKILQKATLPRGVLGGVVGKTIGDMAKVHCKKEALFVMDFKDFFPNINAKRVFTFFRNANCSNEIAGILTDLVTFEKFLPQGFPTSTMIANLIAYDLDIKHLELAKKYNLVRTRWIDDIVFSGRKTSIIDAIPDIIRVVKQYGFKINNKKTKIMPRDARKEEEKPIVTGLRTDRNSPHIPPTKIHKIERLLDAYETESPEIAQQIHENETGRKTKNFQASLCGQVNFVKEYDANKYLELMERMNAIFVKSEVA
jgi:RNA-directed DNA polymerase